MAYPTNPKYKLVTNSIDGAIVAVRTESDSYTITIPIKEGNTDYRQYLQDIKDNGLSIVEVDDCGDGMPNNSLWQYADNAEQLLIDKYGSDSDKLTALREDRYVRAMEAKTPYESMTDADPIINSTSKEIKQKYNLPMRR